MPHSQCIAHQDGLRGVDQQTAKLLLENYFLPLARGLGWWPKSATELNRPCSADYSLGMEVFQEAVSYIGILKSQVGKGRS